MTANRSVLLFCLYPKKVVFDEHEKISVGRKLYLTAAHQMQTMLSAKK